MALSLTYPGVYIQELEPDARTLRGVPTSITAFIGRARRGPVDTPVRVQGFAEFGRIFGGLWEHSEMSYAVNHFFLNGGGDAIIVRVHKAKGTTVPLDTATVKLPTGTTAGSPELTLAASSPGLWGNQLRVEVDWHSTDDQLFHLRVQEVTSAASPEVLAEERFMNLSFNPESSRFITQVLAQESNLVRVSGTVPGSTTTPPADPKYPRPEKQALGTNGIASKALAGGDDGAVISDGNIVGGTLEQDRKGLYALEDADLFNLPVIPPFDPAKPETPVAKGTWDAAAKYCGDRRAFLIVDPPASWKDHRAVTAAAVRTVMDAHPNAAIYFPRIRAADSLKEGRIREFAPSGAIAGVISRTDSTRGVWKAPAGQDATLFGTDSLTFNLTDQNNGLLNPMGVNCLRSFRLRGRVVWGARTTVGADELASQWQYVPVRRTALFIEESLYRGSQWVVFEPNDERLWSQIRLTLGSFMHGLFRQGAFQGTTPQEAYFVKCDGETTLQADIDRGIVNIVVGFAPLKPAEFVVIQIKQIMRQSEG